MRPSWLEVARAATAGLIVATALIMLRAIGATDGAWSYVLLVILMLLVPLSRNLSRRIFLSGAILFGWLPLLWWANLGPLTDRVGWFIAIAYGMFAAWIFGKRNVLIRAKSLVPRLRPVDAIPLATAIAASWVFGPLLSPAGDNRMLGLFVRSGWDHVGHFNMVEMISSMGSMLGTLGTSPDGSPWVYTTYPKHFHILVEAAQEIGAPPVPGISTNIDGYAQGLAIVLIAIAVILAAGLVQLPTLQRRPLIAWPLAAFPVAGFVVGPGTVALSGGYPNFVFACAAVALTACVAVTMVKVFHPLLVLALIGLVVATAHSWLLLLPLAVVAALAAALPLERRRWRTSRTRAWATGIIAVAGVGAFAIAVAVALPDLNQSTLLLGSVDPFGSGRRALAAMMVATAAALAVAFWWQRQRRTGVKSRILALGFVPVCALFILLGLGLLQLQSSHAVGYYFGKFAYGMLLISLVLLVIILSGISPWKRSANPNPRHGRHAVAMIASVLVTIAAIEPFGYVGSPINLATVKVAPGLQNRAFVVGTLSEDNPGDTRLVEASRIAENQPFGETLYLAPLSGDPVLYLANQWHLSLSETWTAKSSKLGEYLDSRSMAAAVATGNFAPEVKHIMSAEPSAKIIVAPELYKKITQGLSPELQHRLLTW